MGGGKIKSPTPRRTAGKKLREKQEKAEETEKRHSKNMCRKKKNDLKCGGGGSVESFINRLR